MGVFEFDKFSAGTFSVAKILADLTPKGCTTIIGGGDSVAAVEQVGGGGDNRFVLWPAIRGDGFVTTADL